MSDDAGAAAVAAAVAAAAAAADRAASAAATPAAFVSVSAALYIRLRFGKILFRKDDVRWLKRFKATCFSLVFEVR